MREGVEAARGHTHLAHTRYITWAEYYSIAHGRLKGVDSGLNHLDCIDALPAGQQKM